MSEFSLTVIGHWGAYPSRGEATSCYLLQAEDTSVLLDCGSGALSVLQEHMSLAAVDAVILSHYHADHIADLGCLQYAARIDTDLKRRMKPLRVYGHSQYAFTERLSYEDCVLGTTYDRNSVLEIGPFRFSFAPTTHPDPCFAVRAECGAASLVYSGDTEPCWELVPFAEGANVLLCETSLYDLYKGKIPGHMSAGEAGELALAAGVGKLVATHLPHWGVHNDLLEQAKAAFGGETVLAQKSLHLEL
ncbi:MAG: MBL fold metallo-hydrolase [Spirochaetia bacterium]|jgi:ribonuclease BN (tRNA processing enzyme)|nr:MBL fold metallo-hydrolase [Spirochaetia bacterium]